MQEGFERWLLVRSSIEATDELSAYTGVCAGGTTLETVLQCASGALFALLEASQRTAPASLRSMMRLMAQWIIATPVSGSLS